MAFNLTHRTGSSDFKGQAAQLWIHWTQVSNTCNIHMLQYSIPVIAKYSQQFKGRRNWYSEAFKFMPVFSKSRRTEQKITYKNINLLLNVNYECELWVTTENLSRMMDTCERMREGITTASKTKKSYKISSKHLDNIIHWSQKLSIKSNYDT